MMINIKKIEVPKKDSNLPMSASKKNKNSDMMKSEQDETATVEDQNKEEEIFKQAIETVMEEAPSGNPSPQTTSITQNKNIEALEGSEKTEKSIQ